MYGYLYNNSFDTSNSSLNLLAQDDDSGGNAQFRLNVTLRANQKYILVVTTYLQSVTGSFSITGSGSSGNITFNHITIVTLILTATPLESELNSSRKGSLIVFQFRILTLKKF